MNIYFKRYMYLLFVAFIALLVVAWMQSRPETVVLDSAHWECKTAIPKGIGTACVQYMIK